LGGGCRLQAIQHLASAQFGIKRYWHKRLVRFGRNTLLEFAENPLDLILEEDDILYIDLGPVFEEWEADFARTLVLGNDPYKKKLCDDLSRVFSSAKFYFQQNPGISGSDLYSYVRSLAEKSGWGFIRSKAGHLISEFPHTDPSADRNSSYIDMNNHAPLRSGDKFCRVRHWVLEIHLIDEKHGFGGFYEDLLTCEWKILVVRA
jgi:Xaa-Pro dipeptidase